jgi:uncharacterized protein
MPPHGREPIRLSRRRFLKVGCVGVVGGGLMCGLGAAYGLEVEPDWIELTRTEVRLPGWPPALDGFAIAQLSDIHCGPDIGLAHIRRGVNLANHTGADLVVLTGDYVTGAAAHSADCARELAALRAPYGIYGVLGNHDIWTNAGVVADNLTAQGITLLRDASASIEIAGSRLWLLGIEDNGFVGTVFPVFQERWRERRAMLERLMGELPAGEPRVLLVHNPDFTEMLPDGRIDLALCGHTHGGQVQIPLAGAPIVPSCFGQKYVEGLVCGPQTLVYVNRGLGLIRPPVRVGCRPEVSLLRIKAAM